MIRAGYDQAELARAIHRSPGYVCARLNGKRAWDLDDVYKICDVLKIEYEELTVVFPPKRRGTRGGAEA